MPNLDGFGLLAALQADPATTDIPVIMVSARAGEEGTIEGLEAGADDYLIKPFAARELLARVHANIELDRARRTRDALRRSGDLLDQAQRLARVGSWEIELATSEVRGSPELLRQLQIERRGARGAGLRSCDRRPRPPRRRRPRARGDRRRGRRGSRSTSSCASSRPTAPPACTARSASSSATRTAPRCGCGASNQDITEQREAERALAAASIADELQRSLLPELTFDAEQLDVAAYYRAGVAGTQVGGDWYDVIDVGAGRTALVLGDVVGRGVRAAAVMGQLRTAVRAYAQLELSPGRRARVPGRGRQPPRPGADRDVPVRGVRPARPVADLRQRGPSAAAAGASRARRAVRLDAAVGPPLGTGAAGAGEQPRDAGAAARCSRSTPTGSSSGAAA